MVTEARKKNPFLPSYLRQPNPKFNLKEMAFPINNKLEEIRNVPSRLDKISYLLYELRNYHHPSFLHSLEVGLLSIEIFNEYIYGLARKNNRDCLSMKQELFAGSLLHDIGKLKIEKKLLDRTKKLSPEDDFQLTGHLSKGFAILQEVGLRELAYFPEEHHIGLGYKKWTKDELQQRHLLSEFTQLADKFAASLDTRRAIHRNTNIDDMKNDVTRLHQKGLFTESVVDAFFRFLEKKFTSNNLPPYEEYYLITETKKISKSLYDKEIFGSLSLTEKLQFLPEEAFTRMRILQPEVGCGNSCADCSQSAYPAIWSLTEKGLSDLMTSISIVMQEISAQRINIHLGSERGRRPDTIFPYLDNDIGSYPYLLEYLQFIHSVLGTKAKISTIGWSRHNERLQKMHQRINKEQLDALVAVNFSLTSYTKALKLGQRSTNHEEYIADLANAMKTYKPTIDCLGTGKESGCVTLRFKPLVNSYNGEMDDIMINGYHVIHSGPYLLISKKPGKPEEAKTDFSTEKLKFTQPGSDYVALISDKWSGSGWEIEANNSIDKIRSGQPIKPSNNVSMEEVVLYSLSNPEGPYFAIDPNFKTDGSFSGKYFYHKTDNRPKSGYNDSTRFFLNALMDYKRLLGLQPLELIPNAEWSDIDRVILILKERALKMSGFDQKASEYLEKEVISLIEIFKKVLQLSGYPPSYFFDPNFTVDTGQILNQGRALNEFKQLTITPNLSTNPQHDRVVKTWDSKTVWRWSVTPDAYHTHKSFIGKNTITERQSIIIQELDPSSLLPYTFEGKRLQEYFITMDEGDIEFIGVRKNFVEQKLIPGLEDN